MTAERVLLACLGTIAVAVFFGQDAVLAQNITLLSLAIAWVATLRAGLFSPGRAGVVLTTCTVGWLALTVWLSPQGANWNAMGWAATGLTLPWLVLRAAHTPLRAAAVTLGMTTATLVVLTQAVAWSSGPDEARIFVYAPTIQWSGYPELGLLACIGCGTMVGLAIDARPLRVRLGAATLGAAFALATLPLGSRSAQATAAFLPLGLAALLLARRVAPMRLAALGLAGLVLVLGALLGTSLGEWLATTLFDANAAWSVTLRQRTWQQAFEAIAARPWLGYGLGGFPGATPNDLAHNFWLHTAAESGIPGALLLTAVWLRAAWRSLRASAARERSGLALAVHGALLAFLVRSLTDHFLAPATPGYWRMWVLQGVWLGLAEAVRSDGDARGPGVSRQPSADV